MKQILYFSALWLFLSSLGCNKTTSAKLVSHSEGNEKTPPFERFTSELVKKKMEGLKPASPVVFKLQDKSEKDSTTYADWFKKNGLELKAVCYHDEAAMMCMVDFKVPDWVKKYVGHEVNGKKYHLSHAVEQEGYVLLFYGNPPDMLHIVNNISLLVVRDINTEAVKYSLDFTLFGMAPEYISRDKDHVFQSIRWAYIEAGILYMENAHWRYAESSKGQNAYITAIDLQRTEMLWRSQPLVANAINFSVMGDVILTAYGFMREGVKVYALDKISGEVVGQLELDHADALGKKHPEYMILKGSTLYIKATDGTEYKVAIQH